MRLWKKICIAAGAAMVSIALVAGCGGTSTKSSTSAESSAASAQSTTSPLAGKHFRVGMSPTYKYFETVKLNNDGSTGYEGLDVDIMDYMAKDMGFTWEVVPSTFDGMIADLQGGGVNMDMLISGMVNTPKRSEVIDFTQGYLAMKIGILYNKDKNQFKNTSDLKGKTLSCGEGENYENQIPYLTDKMTVFQNSSVAVQELLSGRTDGVMTDYTSCKKRASENPTLAYIIVDYADIGGSKPLEYSMAFPKNSQYMPYFNDELTKMKKSGDLEKIIVKWLGQDAVSQ